jgi:hypothetical protein
LAATGRPRGAHPAYGRPPEQRVSPNDRVCGEAAGRTRPLGLKGAARGRRGDWKVSIRHLSKRLRRCACFGLALNIVMAERRGGYLFSSKPPRRLPCEPSYYFLFGWSCSSAGRRPRELVGASGFARTLIKIGETLRALLSAYNFRAGVIIIFSYYCEVRFLPYTTDGACAV